MPRIPGPTPLAAVPAAMKLLRDPRALMREYAARYGTTWQIRMPDRGRLARMVWLLGPDGNERILAPQYRDDFSWNGGYRFTMESMFGPDVLILLDGAAWRERHRKLVPAFHPRMDPDYLAAIRRILAGQIDGWSHGGEIDLAREMKRAAFHVVANLLLGSPDEDVAELERTFEELGQGLYSVFKVPLPGFRFLTGVRARRRLADYLRQKIAEYRRREALPANMLGSLMAAHDDAGEPLPDETLIGEMLAFLFAGYDTTASMLTSFWSALAERPDLLAELRREATAATEISLSALSQQRFMEAVLAEVERMFPPLVFGMRGVARRFEFRGYRFEPGDKVAYSSWFTGRMETVWPQADHFRPERFLDGKSAPPYTLIAFGGGPRACIGRRFAALEMRVVLQAILARCDLAIPRGQPDEVFFNPAMQRKLPLAAKLI